MLKRYKKIAIAKSTEKAEKRTCGGGGVRRREGEKRRRMSIGEDCRRNAVTERE
jgi:hypothetical protein